MAPLVLVAHNAPRGDLSLTSTLKSHLNSDPVLCHPILHLPWNHEPNPGGNLKEAEAPVQTLRKMGTHQFLNGVWCYSRKASAEGKMPCPSSVNLAKCVKAYGESS